MKAVAEKREQEEAQEPLEEQGGYTPEDFERWWARSEELHSVLLRLPQQAVINAGMQRRREQLLERWEELETPGLGDDIDTDMVGALRLWIHDAEVLIRYIIFTQDTGTGPTTAEAENVSANELPTAPRFEPVDSLADASAVTDVWHWPWIKGWDDPAKRRRILSPRQKKETSFKRKLIMGAIGAGALYVGARYLDEED